MLTLAIVAALAAAFCNALAAVLQQGAAKRLEGRGGLSPSQLAVLVRQRRWLAGQASDTAAFLLQAAALSVGALLLVQPIMVLALPFAVLLRSSFARERPGPRPLLGAGGCAVGTGVFLLVARPQEVGRASFAPAEWLEMGIGLAVAVGCFLVMALFTRRNWRALAFALAAAASYGVTAGLVKVVTGQLGQGILEPLSHPELYVAVATGVAGVTLTQNALKPGALAAPVAVLTLGDRKSVV